MLGSVPPRGPAVSRTAVVPLSSLLAPTEAMPGTLQGGLAIGSTADPEGSGTAGFESARTPFFRLIGTVWDQSEAFLRVGIALAAAASHPADSKTMGG